LPSSLNRLVLMSNAPIGKGRKSLSVDTGYPTSWLE